jgi:hypothetical protein
VSALTGGFDAVVLLRQSALGRLLCGMHTTGAIYHAAAHIHGGKRLDAQVGAPALSVTTALLPDGRARALVKSRLNCRLRPAAQPGELGVVAVVDVTARATIDLPGGDPAPVGWGSQVVITWDETTASDIVVHGVSGAPAGDLTAAILDFVRLRRLAFGFPAVGPRRQAIESAALRFVPGAGSLEPALAIGLNFRAGLRGARAALPPSVARSDWALVLSSEYVIETILDRLRQELGRVPPPHGTGPIVLSEGDVCTLQAPLLGCLDTARQRVLLDGLELTLEPGGVVIAAQVSQRTDAWYVPDVSASVRIVARLVLDPTTQRLTVVVDPPSVQLQQWYAQVFNVLSSGTLERAVGDGVRTVLASDLPGGVLSGLISSDALQPIVSLGGAAQVPVGVVAESIEVTTGGIVLHGHLVVGGSASQPVAELVAIPSAASARTRILHAAGAWAPGNRIVAYQWTFGDGQSASSSGTAARVATTHAYATGGTYQACVRVEDEVGRTATKCLTVRPGVLVLQHEVAAGAFTAAWQLCDGPEVQTCLFRVSDELAPVNGAEVVVSTQTWSDRGITGPDGLVAFDLDPARFDRLVLRTQGRPLAAGWVRVEASKPGYDTAHETLWLVSCTGAVIGDIVSARDRVQQWLERHVQLRFEIERLPSIPGSDILGADGRRRMVEAGLALDLLTRLFVLVEHDSDILPATEVLGVPADDRGSTGELARRLQDLVDQVSDRLAPIHERVRRGLTGSDGPPRPD